MPKHGQGPTPWWDPFASYGVLRWCPLLFVPLAGVLSLVLGPSALPFGLLAIPPMVLAWPSAELGND
jgi:hypothetical protein